MQFSHFKAAFARALKDQNSGQSDVRFSHFKAELARAFKDKKNGQSDVRFLPISKLHLHVR